jgi:ATP-dependent Clp protease ATP-binding subunit ClpC
MFLKKYFMTDQFSDKQSSENKVKDNNKGKTPMLDYFGRDLTKMAEEGLLDPVYGREEELKSMINILNKRKKSNPLLIGEQGVGKTAIVEALAQKIKSGNVEMWLHDKRLVEINITSMVSGTKFRGEFEQRMESLIKEIEENDNVIVFFDEIHNVVGAGSTSGSMDAANIIKPALSRGTIKCIGATTLDEYKKYIEEEGAFERRFQKIFVKEPNKKQVLELLDNIKDKYEEYHGVDYSEEIINKCVTFADKYINYRKFPDKAIDLLDEVGAMVKVEGVKTPDHLIRLDGDLRNASKEKKEASDKQEFEKAANWRDKEKEIFKLIEIEKTRFEEKLKENKLSVNFEHVAKIISSHTGIPVNKLTKSDNEKLKGLEDVLLTKVIGQDNAVKKVSEAIQRSRVGFGDPDKPIASFLFLGTTGIGKTYLAKKLAEEIFDVSDSFIRIDMSEFEGPHTISKLIGSPPGFVGYDNKGQLTEKIKNRPYSLILFDEIEKAHQDVFNVMLQILDDGKLTDSHGKEVNFKNCIIIMTSNVGTRKAMESKMVGFGADNKELKEKNIKSNVIKEVESFFKPEFLNRIDEKIIFKPLGKPEIEKITSIELNVVINRINSNGYNVSYEENVVKNIAKIGFDEKYGARPIKRTINDQITNYFTRQVIDGNVKEGESYVFYCEKDEIKIKKTRKNVRNKK